MEMLQLWQVTNHWYFSKALWAHREKTNSLQEATRQHRAGETMGPVLWTGRIAKVSSLGIFKGMEQNLRSRSC